MDYKNSKCIQSPNSTSLLPIGHTKTERSSYYHRKLVSFTDGMWLQQKTKPLGIGSVRYAEQVIVAVLGGLSYQSQSSPCSPPIS